MPYVLEGVAAESSDGPRIINSQTKGVDVFVDLEALDDSSAEQARAVLEEAITALDERAKQERTSPDPQARIAHVRGNGGSAQTR